MLLLLRSTKLVLSFLFFGIVISNNAFAQCASASNIYTFKYQKHTYEVVLENKVWAEAAKCAKDRGGYLVHINNKSEQDVIYYHLTSKAGITNSKTESQFGYGTVWLGGTDSISEGAWIWDGENDGSGNQFWSGGINGSVVGSRYNKWGDEPDNSGNQDALSMTLETTPRNKASEWNDLASNNRIYYVIEYDCVNTNTNIDTSVCTSYRSPSGKIWTQAGNYKDTLPGVLGCDSVFKIKLSIDQSNVQIDTVACGIYQSPSGKTWTLAGTYKDTVLSKGGCDSVLTINLNFNQPSASSINPSACITYTSPSGKTWTSSGTYTDTIPNAKGCDSIITINLSLGNPTYANLSAGACSVYTSPSGKLFDTAGLYVDTILNAKGCDSIITITLSIDKSFYSIAPRECGTYTSPTGKTFTESTDFYDTLTNSKGCDSILFITLTIVESSTHSFQQTACGEFISPSGKVWTSSGQYTDTLINWQRCDSLITIDLTVTAVDTSLSKNDITATSGASNASFQWLDCDDNYKPIDGATSSSYTVKHNMVVAVAVTQESCTDTSRCVKIIYQSLPENRFRNSIQAYPNPTMDVVTLELAEAEETLTVTVLDLTGKALETYRYSNAQKLQIQLPEAEGFYLLQVVSKESKAVLQVLKAAE